jgi:hypothetical protein
MASIVEKMKEKLSKPQEDIDFVEDFIQEKDGPERMVEIDGQTLPVLSSEITRTLLYGTALGSPPTENTSGIGYTFFPPIINATGTKVGYLDKQYEYNSRTNTWDVKMDFNYNIIGYSDTSVALSNTSSVSNTSTDNANFKIDFYNYY